MNWAKEGWCCFSKITKPHVSGLLGLQQRNVVARDNNPIIVSRLFGSGISHGDEVDHQLTREFLVKLWVADRKMGDRPIEKQRRKLVDNGDPRWFSGSSVAEDGGVMSKGERVLKQPPTSQSVPEFLEPEEVKSCAYGNLA